MIRTLTVPSKLLTAFALMLLTGTCTEAALSVAEEEVMLHTGLTVMATMGPSTLQRTGIVAQHPMLEAVLCFCVLGFIVGAFAFVVLGDLIRTRREARRMYRGVSGSAAGAMRATSRPQGVARHQASARQLATDALCSGPREIGRARPYLSTGETASTAGWGRTGMRLRESIRSRLVAAGGAG
jgi:hypothetical protein